MTDFHKQELRIALVMNGGVSLAVWIGGVTQEINRLVRGECLYGRLCNALALSPRVDIISGTSAGGINGALLALAMSQGKSLEPLRDIWRDEGDILTLLRHPTESDPPSFLDGDHFYKAMVKGFRKIHEQPGGGWQPPQQVPIDLTLTTTILLGDVRNFPDDVGTVIRDITHRGRITFRRGEDMEDDSFRDGKEIAAKLAVAARATASFPGAFQPFYLPGLEEKVKIDGESIPCLIGHTDFNQKWEKGRYVVDGGVLDNNPLESAIDAVFHQRAEGEVRRVLAYVVPDPGNIPDPPPQEPDQIPSLLNTALASLISIPRVESISGQLRNIAAHNEKVCRQLDTRLMIARTLEWEKAEEVAEAVFTNYRLVRLHTSVEYIVNSLAAGAARYKDTGETGGIALGRRTRERIADILLGMSDDMPWIPQKFSAFTPTEEWQWGLFSLENIMASVLDILRRGVQLMPVQGDLSTWSELKQMRRQAFNLVAELAALRDLDRGYWLEQGKRLAPELAKLQLESDDDKQLVNEMLTTGIKNWVARLDQAFAEPKFISSPHEFNELAKKIGSLLLRALEVLQNLNFPDRSDRLLGNRLEELSILFNFFSTDDLGQPSQWRYALRRLLTMEIVQFAFGVEVTREQYLELIQFSANVPTAFGGPDSVEEKLAGVQVAHFGAFYKRSWRINDWMFGRLDGADRIIHILLDPKRLARLYGNGQHHPDNQSSMTNGVEKVLTLLNGVVFEELKNEGDKTYLGASWSKRESAMRTELQYLDSGDGIPDQLPECAAMMLERLHLDILRRELPALADAVGDDKLGGADPSGNGPMFLERFRSNFRMDSNLLSGSSPPELIDFPQLPAEQLVELFKGAKVGEEKILKEAGSDRFTLTAVRAAAVTVSALAGKNSGLKWLRRAFAAVRAPLVASDILVGSLLKSGKLFVSLYAMFMAVAATILLSGSLANAEWSNTTYMVAGLILAVGFVVLLRHHLKLLLLALLLVLFLWKGLPWITACF